MPPWSFRNSNKQTKETGNNKKIKIYLALKKRKKETGIVGRTLGHLMELRLAKPPSLEEGQGSSGGFSGGVHSPLPLGQCRSAGF